MDVTCTITSSSPEPAVNQIYWTRMNDPSYRVNGRRLQISNIERDMAGTYKCNAENTMVPTVGATQTGRANKTMLVYVLCKYTVCVNTCHIHLYDARSSVQYVMQRTQYTLQWVIHIRGGLSHLSGQCTA